MSGGGARDAWRSGATRHFPADVTHATPRRKDVASSTSKISARRRRMGKASMRALFADSAGSRLNGSSLIPLTLFHGDGRTTIAMPRPEMVTCRHDFTKFPRTRGAFRPLPLILYLTATGHKAPPAFHAQDMAGHSHIHAARRGATADTSFVQSRAGRAAVAGGLCTARNRRTVSHAS